MPVKAERKPVMAKTMMRIRATAELESFDGRFYTMRVTAHDGSQEIGRGTVGRAVVHMPTLLARMREKAAKDVS